MSNNSEKCSLEFLRAQGDKFKFVVFSEQQSIQFTIMTKKILTFEKLVPENIWHFYLKNG